jgi:hypothetical protein
MRQSNTAVETFTDHLVQLTQLHDWPQATCIGHLSPLTSISLVVSFLQNLVTVRFTSGGVGQ